MSRSSDRAMLTGLTYVYRYMSAYFVVKSVLRQIIMLHVTWLRFISLSRDSFHIATRHRLLSHPSLRPVDPHRHPVLGFVLDQRRRESGARLARPADRVTLTTVRVTSVTE